MGVKLKFLVESTLIYLFIFQTNYSLWANHGTVSFEEGKLLF